MTPAIEGLGLSRAYGGVRALDDASFEARAGEVHALVGENGAGKSTLIKILGGRTRPDAGIVRIKGQPVTLAGPDHAHRLGAWTVFQELTLLPALTVAENLLLSREPRGRLGLIDRRATERRAEEILASLGIRHVDPLAAVEDISLAERQLVEIVRAIDNRPDILFLDEPTSSLVEREVAWLFAQVRRLRDAGACVVFTSHRWNEVTAIADRITVCRNGRQVGTFTPSTIDEDQAVTLMTGRKVETLYPALPARSAAPRPALRVEHLSAPRVHDLSFTLNAGEILGIGGLAGHGHRELFFTLFGADRAAGGALAGDGPRGGLRAPPPAQRRDVGIALVPEDRKTEGLLLRMSVRDNATLAILKRLSRAGLLRRALEARLSTDIAGQLKVKAAGPDAPVGSLSGGNQQKVLLGRWLLAEPRILLLYDVTRGVDVATKSEIYALIGRLARENKAILFYSSDAEELAHLTHRVLVMREGRLAAELTQPTAEDIVSASVRDAA